VEEEDKEDIYMSSFIQKTLGEKEGGEEEEERRRRREA